MKKLCLILFALVAVSTLGAQESAAPDYNDIRQKIFNPKHPNYYPALVKRYLENDTTLTLEEYRCLYYGYSLQEDFVPYQREHQQLFDIRRRLAQSGGAVALCSDAQRQARTVLEDNPFDLLAISTYAIAALQLGDSTAWRQMRGRQEDILDVIISSGDGETPESAFHVIAIEHEYEVLNRLGLEVEKDSLVSPTVEYLKVKPNADDEDGFYFDFSACRNIYDIKYSE